MKFAITTPPIQKINPVKCPKLLRLLSVLYDATLCNKLFPSDDGTIKNISINASHRAHIPV